MFDVITSTYFLLLCTVLASFWILFLDKVTHFGTKPRKATEKATGAFNTLLATHVAPTPNKLTHGLPRAS